MKKKNTIFTALIALFIVFAGVKSVEAKPSQQDIDNLMATKMDSSLITTKYHGDVAGATAGVLFWGKSGELAFYEPSTGKVSDPISENELSEIESSIYGGNRYDHLMVYYIAEFNKSQGYDSLEKIKEGIKKTPKSRDETFSNELFFIFSYRKYSDFKYIGDVASNSWGIFYYGTSGRVAWYYPETGKVSDPRNSKEIEAETKYEKGPFETGDGTYGHYIAEVNKRRGYDSLEKIKEGMKKPKSDTTVKAEEPLKKQETELKDKKEDKSTTQNENKVEKNKDKKSEEKPTTQKQGWVQENGKWFYYDQSNNKQSGWVQVNGAWYYLAQDGEMKTGWLNQGGSWYYLTESGSMKTGWQNVNGTWYYLNGSGAMQTGWLNQSGTCYYLNSSGSMQTGWLSQSGTWYYLTESGSMKTGWYQVSTKWYYFYSSGALAVSTTVDGYTVNANGEWI